MRLRILCILTTLLLPARVLRAAEPASMQQQFADPPDDARPMVRWWWFGPAVTQPEIQREMAAMKAGGFGGFELQTTYPLATGTDPPGVSNFKFLSPEHLSDIHFAAEQAKAMNLRMDLTLGSGWPYGGATTPIDMAAGRLRMMRTEPTSRPATPLRDGETLLATVGNTSFISSRTRMMVKRPAWGAEGFVVDHLDRTAVRHFLDTIATPAVDACGPNMPHALFCDSLECYGEDWTPRFLDEFRRRRGYDLTPLLPALLGDADPTTAEIRHDWGQTLTELFNDNFIKPLADYAHAHHALFRIQAYGTPSAGLSSYLGADLPEGEGFQWHNYRATRYASSACHLMGVPVSSSETFTWIHPPVFRATPLDIKAEANLHFLQGVNQVICHGWPYSPPQAGEPGWSFYASGVFNDHNPWWAVMPDVTKYLTRCSWMLRQGQPANDVLLYLANDDAWAHFTPGHVSLSDGVGERLGPSIVGDILDAGYNLDFFDDQMLAARGKVDGDSIAFGDLRYKVVILAGVERIPPATLATMEKFVDGGGILIATRNLPSLAPGHLASAADQQAVHDSVQRLFHWDHRTALFVPDESKLASVLRPCLKPDALFLRPSPQIGVVHRHSEDKDIYFFANTSNQTVESPVELRGAREKGIGLDPVTAAMNPINPDNLAIRLEPYESVFVVFNGAPVQLPRPRAGNPPTMAPMHSRIDPKTARDISAGWKLKFPDAAEVATAALRSWTADPATANFSGTAVYTQTVANPLSLRKYTLDPIVLDFGRGHAQPPRDEQRPGAGFAAALDPPVAEAAVAYVNGQRAGAVWCPPYALDVTSLVKPGDNDLQIEVSNTAVNELAAGKFPNYDYPGLVKEFGNRFQPARASQFEPVPSGLLGPITLTAQP